MFAFDDFCVENTYTLWSFPLCMAFPYSEYYDHADSSHAGCLALGSWRISRMVSRPVLPLSFTPLEKSPMFTVMNYYKVV